MFKKVDILNPRKQWDQKSVKIFYLGKMAGSRKKKINFSVSKTSFVLKISMF